MNKLILASASPRRLELLRQLGLACDVHPVNLDERLIAGELPEDYVMRMAREKADAAVIDSDADLQTTAVLGADTIVVLGGDIMGKPRDRLDALAMLARLGGRTHLVITGVAVRGPMGATETLSSTTVSFRALERAECERYWQTGEPSDKAGSYAIQGMGALFVDSIEGSYSGVVGLPLLEVWRLLREQGVYTTIDDPGAGFNV